MKTKPNPSPVLYSHGGTGGSQKLLQSALPARCSQLVGQQRKDGVGAPQTHTVHHQRLYRRKLRLVEEEEQKKLNPR